MKVSLLYGFCFVAITLGSSNNYDVSEPEDDDMDEFVKDYMDETEKDDVDETEKDDVDETEKDDVDETEKDDVDETVKDDVDETEKDDMDETEKDDVDETEKDDVDDLESNDVDDNDNNDEKKINIPVKTLKRLFKRLKEWTDFKHKYNKGYDDKEDQKRFPIFCKNSEEIDRRNKLYSKGNQTYQLGMNQFGDMDHEEFASQKRGFLPGGNMTGGDTYHPLSNFTSKDVVNWTAEGYVTPVKDQQQCGSCWAFSSTGALEAQHFRATRKLISLSEQNLLDCTGSYGNQGCGGGFMDNAFEYVKDEGISSEEDYPYTANPGTCANIIKSATCTGYVNVSPNDETTLMKAVGEIGPVSVALCGSSYDFQFYKTGVFNNPGCGNNLDHAVLITGYGTASDGGDYWIIKNSWNTYWGEYGYMRIARNTNQCGIASIPSYPKID